MALINITGGKYTTQTLSAVGTTSVTIGTSTFVSTDFNPTQRMVALFTSAGAFKGIAWVRRFTSTTVLELENQFVDPVTGLFATQVVGDNLMVSRNASETANTADWVVTPIPLSTTTNDALTFGTTNTNMSVCFYEENMDFNTRSHVRCVGGVVVFGKLMNYDGVSKESFVWSRECNIKPRTDYLNSGGGGGNAVQYNVFAIGTTAAHTFMFGGMVGGSYQSSNFLGSEGLTGLANGSFGFYGTRMNYGCASPSNGSPWPANPTRHLLYKTIHEARYTNANLIMWGDGAAFPAFVSFPQYGTGSPLGVFRASSAVTFGSSTNNRTIVNDLGTGALVDDANANGVYTFKNVISPAINIVRFAGGTCPITFQFEDDYTNLQNRTTLVVQRGDGVIATSTVNTASSTFTATVTQATYSGTANGNAIITAFYTTFYYTVKCYGYSVVNGTHSTYTYSLGTAGNGTNLKLGGLINQLVDSNVTLSETAALALSSKFSINSGTKVITVSANATYDELYDYVVAWNCSSAANAVLPNLSQYVLSANGSTLTAFEGWGLIVNTGVTLSSGTKFDKIVFTTILIINSATMPYLFNVGGVLQATGVLVPSTVLGVQDTYTGSGAITGIYQDSTGTSTVLQISGFDAGSSVYVEDNSAVQKFYSASASGTVTVYIPPTGTGSWYYAVEKYGNQRQSDFFTFSGGLKAIVVKAIPDTGITQATQATVAAYTALETPDKIYDYVAYLRLSVPHISYGQITFKNGTSLDLADSSILVNQSATAVASFNYTTKLLTIKSTSLSTGVTYDKIITTPPEIITANTNEVISVNIEDANGDSSVTIQGGSGNFTLWKITNATDEDDYATGVNLGTVANITYRFLSAPGYKIVIRDNTTGFRQVVPMDKDNYTRGLFFGDQVQLAQSQEVTQINTKVDTVLVDLTGIKGTGFTKDTHSLINIKQAVDDVPTTEETWSNPTRTLTVSSGGATLEEIEASTILAKQAALEVINTGVKKASKFIPHNTNI